jgi:hypothetical protein
MDEDIVDELAKRGSDQSKWSSPWMISSVLSKNNRSYSTILGGALMPLTRRTASNTGDLRERLSSLDRRLSFGSISEPSDLTLSIPTMSGPIIKRGFRFRKRWVKRWFRLSDCILTYYEDCEWPGGVKRGQLFIASDLEIIDGASII